MDVNLKSSTRGDSTREALLEAATEVFARHGFHAVTLREIAENSGINQALIGYHFRNKEGLYLAVFERMVEQMRKRLDPQEIEPLLQEELVPGQVDHYLQPILRVFDGMVLMMAHEQSEAWAMLITREQQFPTAASKRLSEGYLGGMIEAISCLIQRIRLDDTPEQVRLLVATLMGQVLTIRVSRAGVMHLLRWDDIGDREIEAFQKQIRRNATLLILGD